MMNKYFIIVFAVLVSFNVSAQTYEGKFLEANYDESKVPAYILPDVLTTFDGKSINTVEEWEKLRSPEIVEFFTQNMFGEVPAPLSPIKKSFQLISEDENILMAYVPEKIY